MLKPALNKLETEFQKYPKKRSDINGKMGMYGMRVYL